jgi:hypothetical protein
MRHQIQALTDEELADYIITINNNGCYCLLCEEDWKTLPLLMTEAARRSALAASQRAARGEQPLPMEEA